MDDMKPKHLDHPLVAGCSIGYKLLHFNNIKKDMVVYITPVLIFLISLIFLIKQLV